MERIEKPLKRLFEKHRIVFWYDTKKELRHKFEALELTGIEKVEINNNEFQLKYRILREEMDTNFLLYFEGPRPEDTKNWFLDVLLTYGDFRTDQAAIWLNELELQPEFLAVVEEHKDFFNAAKRREALKSLLEQDDTKSHILLKMIAVCTKSEPRLDSIFENLLAELSDEKSDALDLIIKAKLDTLLWKRLAEVYGYKSDSASIEDLAIELFKSCYAESTGSAGKLTPEALVFLKRWKDSRRHQKTFEVLSDKYAEILSIQEDLEHRDYRTLVDIDYFSMIDKKILSGLARDVANQTLSPGECSVFIRQRRQSHWFSPSEHMYEAIDNASQFMGSLANTHFQMTSMADGIRKYANIWYRIDQFYRKYILCLQRAGNPPLLNELTEKIENLYTNGFLLKLNDNWQTFVDAATEWDASPIPLQNVFYKKWVSPFLTRDKKVFVVISDALRFEAGEEMVSRIRREDRYEASIEPLLSMLPSYTQLGMAALLPHKTICMTDEGKIFADGVSTQGTLNRDKILKKNVSGGALAVRGEDFLSMTKEKARELFRENSVVYIYHNRIDAAGDKKDSEHQAFEAVEKTEDDLITIIKKLTGANATNLIVTADHGFIYQNRPIEDSDFSGAEVIGDLITQQDRRFVIGKGLKENPGLKKFTASNLGLLGDMEALIPKSINRLRLKGSGSRYVHGGASLQEVVLPVIHINKKRTSDVSAVEVDILRGTTEVITSSQLAVVFYQAQPATDKVAGRKLVAGIYSTDGTLISDKHDIHFDLQSDNPREREISVRFLLSRDADNLNNQEVVLKLEEKVGATTHYREYKTARYRLRRSFTSDFDF